MFLKGTIISLDFLFTFEEINSTPLKATEHVWTVTNQFNFAILRDIFNIATNSVISVLETRQCTTETIIYWWCYRIFAVIKKCSTKRRKTTRLFFPRCYCYYGNFVFFRIALHFPSLIFLANKHVDKFIKNDKAFKVYHFFIANCPLQINIYVFYHKFFRYSIIMSRKNFQPFKLIAGGCSPCVYLTTWIVKFRNVS